MPYCERVEIAGSIRRGKPIVKDIEIVAMPKMVPQLNLFREQSEPICPIKTICVPELITNGAKKIKGDNRYFQLELPEGINLDLFIVLPPAQWGVIFCIRTGPADFSHWLVTQKSKNGAMPPCFHVHDGGLYNRFTGELIPTPDETDFFEKIGLKYIEPGNRVSPWSK